MNNEEAQYRFRRTVAEVVKVLTEPDEPARSHSQKPDATIQDRNEAQDNGL